MGIGAPGSRLGEDVIRGPKGVAAGLAVTLALGAACGLGGARAESVKKDIEAPGLETEERVRAGEASKAARGSKLEEGEDVTYEQVLADPDNVGLNFRYAQTQIREGDLLGASATLERILLIKPGLHRVRVLYAIVLFRLDNLEEAERELAAVAALDVPAELRSEIERYRDEVALRKKRTRFTLLLNLGYQYDTNRKASPTSKELETFFGRLRLSGDNGRQPDHSIQGLARFSVEHDLGFQARHAAFGSLTYYHGDQSVLDRLTLQSLGLEAGGRYDLSPVTVTPTGFWRFARLSHEPFLKGYGGRLRLDYRYSKSLNLFAAYRGEVQKFFAVHESPALVDRIGPEFRTTAGVEYVLGPRMRMAARTWRLRKEAREDFNEYRAYGVALDHTWLLGRGLFLLSHLSAEFNLYDRPDLFISIKGRRHVTLGYSFISGLNSL